MRSEFRKRKASRVIKIPSSTRITLKKAPGDRPSVVNKDKIRLLKGATTCRIDKKWLDSKRKETRCDTKKIEKQSIGNKTSSAKLERAAEAVTNNARHIWTKEDTLSKTLDQIRHGKSSATASGRSLPSGSWEDDIQKVADLKPWDDSRGRPVVYLIWNDGGKTKHDWDIICKKCPKKLGELLNDLLADSS